MHWLLGNHEEMLLQGDYDYVDDHDEALEGQPLVRGMHGEIVADALKSPGYAKLNARFGPVVKGREEHSIRHFLNQHGRAMVKVGGTLFVHAGITVADLVTPEGKGEYLPGVGLSGTEIRDNLRRGPKMPF